MSGLAIFLLVFHLAGMFSIVAVWAFRKRTPFGERLGSNDNESFSPADLFGLIAWEVPTVFVGIIRGFAFVLGMDKKTR